MSSVPIQEDELLRAQIREARQKINGLEDHLQSIDAELNSLSEQRERFELLEQACGTLEQLDELGGADLFWGSAEPTRTSEHVSEARNRVASFRERLGEIEGRRHAVVDQIKGGQQVLDILEYDLYEYELEEEERKQEWVIERELVLPDRPTVMPWARGEDSERFRKSLTLSMLYALLFGLIVPQIDLPLPDLSILPDVPERLARLIEEQALPPPPPPVVLPEPEDIEPEPILAEELPDEVPEVPQETTPTVSEEPAPPAPAPARPAGILAFRDAFSSLAANREAAPLGAQARINNAGEAAVGRTERAMITSQAPGSSGGINLASLSRDVGQGGTGTGIDGVEVGRVASSIGTGGTSDRPLSGGATAGRTDEEIQIVFDRYKAALYRLYNRELRNDPTLQGQVVLQLTIEPDGSVSFCQVSASDMGAPVLEQQVVDRVLTFDFGAKEDIAPITILYPIDFLPAA